MDRDERRHAFPIGAEIRMTALSANPYPLFQRLHADEPVSWLDEIEMWVVARRADVQAILADPVTFTVLSPRSVLRRILGRNMLTTEGDEQNRLRNPFSHTFAARTVRQTMRAPIAAQAEALIEHFYEQGKACLVDLFSDRLALTVLGAVVGLPIEDYDVFRGWFHDFNAALGNFTGEPTIEARGLRAQVEFEAYVRAVLHARRYAPDDTLVSELAARGTLSDEEIADSLRVIFFGGIETTSALLVNAVWALLQHPAAFDRVRAQPDLLNQAIEETFRWESPVQTCTRHVTQPMTIQGVQIQPGETVQCLLGAANRDPLVFAQPDTFDLDRPNSADHLAFGTGRHFCIGSALARLEAQIGLRILLDRLTNLRAAPGCEGDAPSGHEFRAPAQLRVEWDVV